MTLMLSKIYEFILMIIDYIIFILLCLFIFVNCTKIHNYVSQITTSTVYPYTYQRTKIPNGQPLFIEQRRRYTTANTLRKSN